MGTDVSSINIAKSYHSTPLVSVIMGVYNGQRFLRQALDSILATRELDHVTIAVQDWFSNSLIMEQWCSVMRAALMLKKKDHRPSSFDNVTSAQEGARHLFLTPFELTSRILLPGLD